MKTQTSYRLAALLLLWLGFGGLLSAQELRYDESRRMFILRYTDDAGLPQRVEITPPNHIEPVVDVQVQTSPTGPHVYRYAIRNQVHPLSTQSIWTFEIPCPGTGNVSALQAATNWIAKHQFTERTQSFVCEFSATRESAEIAPGRSATGFSVTSAFLPGIVEIAVWGSVNEIVPLPGVEEPYFTLAELYAQAVGGTNGWYRLSVVAPGRAPTELNQPVSALRLVQSDLNRACELGWVSNAGVCESLRSKLREVEAALVRGDKVAARGQLRSYIAELDAQRGVYVNESAYWLLKTNAEYILARL